MEIGFGGLLTLASGMHLPRQLAYWLLSRVNPINNIFTSPDGMELRFPPIQVNWVLGIPIGEILFQRRER